MHSLGNVHSVCVSALFLVNQKKIVLINDSEPYNFMMGCLILIVYGQFVRVASHV